jgi:hypothetical protein
MHRKALNADRTAIMRVETSRQKFARFEKMKAIGNKLPLDSPLVGTCGASSIVTTKQEVGANERI